jgi:hypothetical protein
MKLYKRAFCLWTGLILGGLFLNSAYPQVITEDVFKSTVKEAQEKCIGAHESIEQRANEDFAHFIWGKTFRFNGANIIRFFNRSSGEKVSAGVDINSSHRGEWGYTFDQQKAADLLTSKGVRITQSYNTLWIKANQVLLQAESEYEGHKIVFELYCPQQRFLEILRLGQSQSIEFIITGYKGSLSANSRIQGVLTEVHAQGQVVKCINGHEFDKAAGYKFCPTCGEPLE